MAINLFLEKPHGSYVLKSEHSDHAPRYVLEGDELMTRGVVPQYAVKVTVSSLHNSLVSVASCKNAVQIEHPSTL